MERVLALSPSKLEAFNKFVHKDDYDFEITAQDTIDALLGVKKFKFAFDFGNSVHDFIERKYTGEGADQGILYPKEQRQLEALCDEHLGYLQDATFEEWHTWHPREDVMFNMRLDILYGSRIEELKTSSKPKTIKDYIDSMQWRIYMLATGARLIKYNVFSYSKKKDILSQWNFKQRLVYGGEIDDVRVGQKIRAVYPMRYHAFNIIAYEGMKDDVMRLIDDLIYFCKDEGIIDKMKYVEEK